LTIANKLKWFFIRRYNVHSLYERTIAPDLHELWVMTSPGGFCLWVPVVYCKLWTYFLKYPLTVPVVICHYLDLSWFFSLRSICMYFFLSSVF
jgi:hypothetical protein